MTAPVPTPIQPTPAELALAHNSAGPAPVTPTAVAELQPRQLFAARGVVHTVEGVEVLGHIGEVDVWVPTSETPLGRVTFTLGRIVPAWTPVYADAALSDDDLRALPLAELLIVATREGHDVPDELIDREDAPAVADWLIHRR